MRGGNVFTLFTSGGGGGHPIQLTGGGGYLIPGPGRGGTPFQGGYPIQLTGGYPTSGPGGGVPQWGGTHPGYPPGRGHLPRLPPSRGHLPRVPPSRGVPTRGTPSPHKGTPAWGTPPQLEYPPPHPGTYYTAVGMPLAFSRRRTFLFFKIFPRNASIFKKLQNSCKLSSKQFVIHCNNNC